MLVFYLLLASFFSELQHMNHSALTNHSALAEQLNQVDQSGVAVCEAMQQEFSRVSQHMHPVNCEFCNCAIVQLCHLPKPPW